jgi:hypothetical protein
MKIQEFGSDLVLLMSSAWPFYAMLRSEDDRSAVERLNNSDFTSGESTTTTTTTSAVAEAVRRATAPHEAAGSAENGSAGPAEPKKGILMAKLLSFMKIHSLRMPLFLPIPPASSTSYRPNTELLLLVLQQAEAEISLISEQLRNSGDASAKKVSEFLGYLKSSCLVGSLLSWVALGNGIHLRQNFDFFEGSLEWRVFEKIIEVTELLENLNGLGTTPKKNGTIFLIIFFRLLISESFRKSGILGTGVGFRVRGIIDVRWRSPRQIFRPKKFDQKQHGRIFR